jgi:hypothetical protein
VRSRNSASASTVAASVRLRCTHGHLAVLRLHGAAQALPSVLDRAQGLLESFNLAAGDRCLAWS